MELILQDLLVHLAINHKSESYGDVPLTIIEAAKLGDEDAFNDIYTKLAPSVFSYLRSKLRPEEVEDTISEVFLKMWKKLHTFEGTEYKQLKGWVLRIAYHMTVDTYRARKEVLEITAAHEVADEDFESNPAYVTLRSLTFERVEGAMKELPGSYREVLSLKYIQGLDYETISVILDTSEGNVRTLTHRGIKKLQSLLDATQE